MKSGFVYPHVFGLILELELVLVQADAVIENRDKLGDSQLRVACISISISIGATVVLSRVVLAVLELVLAHVIALAFVVCPGLVLVLSALLGVDVSLLILLGDAVGSGAVLIASTLGRLIGTEIAGSKFGGMLSSANGRSSVRRVRNRAYLPGEE